MNRFSLLVASAAALMAVNATAKDRVVNVYNWSDYIDETILEEFTKETGIKVVYDVFDSNEVLETKLLAGKSGYDVVVPTGPFLQRQIQAKVFRKLDKSKLPNLKHSWDVVASRLSKYDPGNNYAVNYMWGTTGIGINPAKVKEVLGPDAPVNSLALVFDPKNMEKLAKCGVHMLDAADEVIPAALRYNGIDPDAKDAKSLAVAEKTLMGIRQYVQKWNSSEYINALANGDICVAFGWSGDVLQARDRAAEANKGVEVEYHIPKEGALMWFDNMAIPADAKNVEEAHIFINYIQRPDVIAKASNFVYYANGNKDSQALLNEDVIGDTAIYPDEATLKNLYTISPAGPKEQRAITRLWTKVTTGK